VLLSIEFYTFRVRVVERKKGLEEVVVGKVRGRELLISVEFSAGRCTT